METSFSRLPLPILPLCLSRLFPADVPSLACAQAVCKAFRLAVSEALQGVEEVNLSPNNRITEKVALQGVWLLRNTPGVKVLKATNCSPFPFVEEVSTCRHLVELNLAHCNLSDMEMVRILSTKQHHPTMPCLQILSLQSSGGHISGEGWLTKRILPQLLSLNLAWCHNITPNGIAELGSQLEHLDLHGCSLVDDSVCSNLRKVIFLDLCFASVTDHGLNSLVSATQMETLNLSENHSNLWACGKWTRAGLLKFMRTMPNVQVVLNSC